MARKGKKPAARRPRRAKPAKKPKAKPRAKAARRASKPPKKIAKAPKPAKPHPAPLAKLSREELDEVTVCSIEFLSDNRSFIARLDTAKGGMREHKAPSFMDLLELVAEDLREEFLET